MRLKLFFDAPQDNWEDSDDGQQKPVAQVAAKEKKSKKVRVYSEFQTIVDYQLLIYFNNIKVFNY